MAEIAGLALGVVPIISAALTQYATLHQICKRYRHKHSDLCDLHDGLNIQRLIFNNETMLLLRPVVGLEIAKQMVNDPAHTEWKNEALSSRLDEILGSSADVVRIVVELICTRMDTVETMLQDISRKRGKLKYAISENKLTKMQQDIRDATSDYRALRAQVQDIVSVKSDAAVGHHTSRGAQRIKATRAAAGKVYEILAVACRHQVEHKGQLSLKPTYTNPWDDRAVKFQLAYHHLSDQTPSPHGRNPLWFVVESMSCPTTHTLSPSSSHTTALSSIAKAQERKPSPYPVSKKNSSLPNRSTSKTPTNAVLNSRTLEPTSASGSIATSAREDTAADFCANLSMHCNNSLEAPACILEQVGLSQEIYRVYAGSGQLVSPIQTHSSAGDDSLPDPNSLAELLRLQKASAGSTSLPVLQRLRVAKILAAALLNFYATPWMQSSWDSHNLIVHNLKPLANSSVDAFKEPEVFVDVQVPNAGISTGISTRTMSLESTTQSVTTPMIRNPALFRLGVLLLELAFEKPLQDMCSASSPDNGAVFSGMDVMTALQRSKEVAAQLGSRFSTIVERCLYCDFGCGADLTQQTLQLAVQRDVVAEIENLETGLQTLGFE